MLPASPPQVRQKSYEKDLKLSYHPFLPILGTGLVTADGELWQKQRLLMGPTLRVEVLDDIVSIAYTAVNRCDLLGLAAVRLRTVHSTQLATANGAVQFILRLWSVLSSVACVTMSP